MILLKALLFSLSVTADQVAAFYKPVLVHTHLSSLDMLYSYIDSVYERRNLIEQPPVCYLR
jgi:hypothetical protein